MKKIILKLDIKDTQLSMTLKQGRIVVDELSLPLNRDLDEQLLGGLDKLFKRNKLNKDSMIGVEISSNIEKNSSYWNIMTAFRKGLLDHKN